MVRYQFSTRLHVSASTGMTISKDRVSERIRRLAVTSVLVLFCGVLGGCGKPPEFEPRLDVLPLKEVMATAPYVAVGRVSDCSPMEKRIFTVLSTDPARGRIRIEVPYRRYSCDFTAMQWLRTDSKPQEPFAFVMYWIANRTFDAEYGKVVQSKRLWFMRKAGGALRPVTDRGSSSIALQDLPEGVYLRADDGGAKAVAGALLDEKLALNLPAYADQLAEFITLASDFLPREEIAEHLEQLRGLPRKAVQDAACAQLYMLFDRCVSGAVGLPYFSDLEKLRRGGRLRF